MALEDQDHEDIQVNKGPPAGLDPEVPWVTLDPQEAQDQRAGRGKKAPQVRVDRLIIIADVGNLCLDCPKNKFPTKRPLDCWGFTIVTTVMLPLLCYQCYQCYVTSVMLPVLTVLAVLSVSLFPLIPLSLFSPLSLQ